MAWNLCRWKCSEPTGMNPATCFKHIFLAFVLWNKRYLCFGLNKQSKRGGRGRGHGQPRTVLVYTEFGSPGKGESNLFSSKWGVEGSVVGPFWFWVGTGRSSCWPDATCTVLTAGLELFWSLLNQCASHPKTLRVDAGDPEIKSILDYVKS